MKHVLSSFHGRAIFAGLVWLSIAQGIVAMEDVPEGEHDLSPEAIAHPFAGKIRAEVDAICAADKIVLPAHVATFLDALEEGLDADIARLWEMAGSDEFTRDNAWYRVWPSLLEAGGFWEQVQEWDARLLNDYARLMLDGLAPGSVYFGGTDPGRFVPTAYSVVLGEPAVTVLTQNALADNMYMALLRFRHGETMWIPSREDSNRAFQGYVQDVQAGRIPAGAEVSIVGGRVSVQGVQGVMMINGILAKMIFDANKADLDFYIEESYVIPWMYPHLEPHGLIFRLHAEPMEEVDPASIAKDRSFWDQLTERLLTDEAFRDSEAARKTYSKLRSAIGGLYAYRRLYEESEDAFKQAIRLYPLSPEANFRLADVYLEQSRFSEARNLIEVFLEKDPENVRVRDFFTQITAVEKKDIRRRELEAILSERVEDVDLALELADIYRSLSLGDMVERLLVQILEDPGHPPEVTLRIAQVAANAQRPELAVAVLERHVQTDSENMKAWIDLAAAYAAQNRRVDAMRSLQRAVELDGEQARSAVRDDVRFLKLRETEEFQRLVPSGSRQ